MTLEQALVSMTFCGIGVLVYLFGSESDSRLLRIIGAAMSAFFGAVVTIRVAIYVVLG